MDYFPPMQRSDSSDTTTRDIYPRNEITANEYRLPLLARENNEVERGESKRERER